MYSAILKSSLVASAFGAVVIAAALSASSVAPSASIVGQKGDLLAMAYKADGPDFGGYRTTATRDADQGVFTLTRSASAD